MINPTKPVRTREGYRVRIITWTGGTKEYPIVGVVEYPGRGDLHSWTCEGSYIAGSPAHDLDLVNVPEVTKRYGVLADITTYEHLYQAKANRDTWMPGCRITEISYENGKPVKVDILDD